MKGKEDAFAILRDAWLEGRAIVPLFGGGISAAAGIPLTRQLVDYLVKICWHSGLRGFADPDKYILQSNWPSRHQLNVDLRELWSRTANDRSVEAWGAELDAQRARALDRAWEATCARVNAGLHADRRFSSGVSMMLGDQWEISANRPSGSKRTADWVSLLHYIAGGNEHLVDAFFARLVRNRFPHGGHQFVAYLTKLQNWKLILTTNFDDLIETALRNEGLNPIVYEFIADEIPAATLVGSHLSVLKLHGGAFHLRAGFNLAEPLDNDRQGKFAAYISSGSVMFVLGYGGGDERVMSLLNGIGENLTKLIWVYRRSAQPPQLAGPLETKLVPVPYDDGALFLQELYTRSNLTYPASRTYYRILRPIPEVPASVGVATTTEVADASPPTGLVLMHAGGDGQGLRQAMLRKCQAYEREGYFRLWFNLYEFSSLYTFLSVFVEDLRRLDRALPLLMLSPGADPNRWLRWIAEALNRSKYIVAIDGVRAFANDHPAAGQAQSGLGFRDLVMMLAQHAKDFGESVVIASSIGEPPLETARSPVVKSIRVDTGAPSASGADQRARARAIWEEGTPAEQELLVVAAAFRRPRGIVGLSRLVSKRLSRKRSKQNDVTWQDDPVGVAERSLGDRAPVYLEVERLVHTLATKDPPVLLRQEGGFYSMDPALRNALYEVIREQGEHDLVGLHHDIADYYRVTMYEQSKDFYAYTEYIFHRTASAVGSEATRRLGWFVQSLDRERDYVIGRGHASALLDILDNVELRVPKGGEADRLRTKLHDMRRLVLRSVASYDACLSLLHWPLSPGKTTKGVALEDQIASTRRELSYWPDSELARRAEDLIEAATTAIEVAKLKTAKQVVATDPVLTGKARQLLTWCNLDVLPRLSRAVDAQYGLNETMSYRIRMLRADALAALMDLEVRGVNPWERPDQKDRGERYGRVMEAYNEAIDLLRDCRQEDDWSRLQTKLRCLSARAAAFAHKFSQANQELNRAHAFAARPSSQNDHLSLGMYWLHRAEYCMLHVLAGIAGAGARSLLASAAAALEQAERSLAEGRREIAWWGRLYILKARLQIFRLSSVGGSEGSAAPPVGPFRRADIEDVILDGLAAINGGISTIDEHPQRHALLDGLWDELESEADRIFQPGPTTIKISEAFAAEWKGLNMRSGLGHYFERRKRRFRATTLQLTAECPNTDRGPGPIVDVRDISSQAVGFVSSGPLPNDTPLVLRANNTSIQMTVNRQDGTCGGARFVDLTVHQRLVLANLLMLPEECASVRNPRNRASSSLTEPHPALDGDRGAHGAADRVGD